MNTGPLSPKELERLAELLRKIGQNPWHTTVTAIHGDGWTLSSRPEKTDMDHAEFIVWAMEQIEELRPGSHLEKFKTGDVYRVGISQPFADYETIWANGPNLATALARALLVVLEEK